MIAAGTLVIAGEPITQARYYAELLEPCELSSFYKDLLPCSIINVLEYPLQVDSLQGLVFQQQRPLHRKAKAKLMVYSLALPKTIESMEDIRYKQSLSDALLRRIQEAEKNKTMASITLDTLLSHKRKYEGQDV